MATKAKSTEAQKARRSASYARGEQRKRDHAAAQDKRAALNRVTRAAGGLTPWQLACADRATRRARRQRTS